MRVILLALVLLRIQWLSAAHRNYGEGCLGGFTTRSDTYAGSRTLSVLVKLTT